MQRRKEFYRKTYKTGVAVLLCMARFGQKVLLVVYMCCAQACDTNFSPVSDAASDRFCFSSDADIADEIDLLGADVTADKDLDAE